MLMARKRRAERAEHAVTTLAPHGAKRNVGWRKIMIERVKHATRGTHLKHGCLIEGLAALPTICCFAIVINLFFTRVYVCRPFHRLDQETPAPHVPLRFTWG